MIESNVSESPENPLSYSLDIRRFLTEAIETLMQKKRRFICPLWLFSEMRFAHILPNLAKFEGFYL